LLQKAARGGGPPIGATRASQAEKALTIGRPFGGGSRLAPNGRCERPFVRHRVRRGAGGLPRGRRAPRPSAATYLARSTAACGVFPAGYGGSHQGGGASDPAFDADRARRAVKLAGSALHASCRVSQAGQTIVLDEDPMRADEAAHLAPRAEVRIIPKCVYVVCADHELTVPLMTSRPAPPRSRNGGLSRKPLTLVIVNRRRLTSPGHPVRPGQPLAQRHRRTSRP
jgi:hypothetical protein